jgi:ABC-2 type transport system ATP-binding protein
MIQTQALTRRFGDFVAARELTFNVGAGTILALLGPNGAGKTTTVRMLAALLAPSSGEARVAGYDVRRDPDAVRASVGLVTDAPGLYEQMTVIDYLNLFGTIYGLPAPERRRRIQELVAFFELEPYRDRRMVAFSKGMKQKVALARALIHDPPVLYLDEPTAGLDPLAARAVRELIQSLKQGRRAIILCTHDLDEAERLADDVAILRQGEIVAQGPPSALRAQAAAHAVCISLAAPAPGAVEALQDIPGVTSLRANGRDGAGADITYDTADPVATNPQVVAHLVGLGARVVSIAIETPSLEDVYASLMGETRSELSITEIVGQHADHH